MWYTLGCNHVFFFFFFGQADFPEVGCHFFLPFLLWNTKAKKKKKSLKPKNNIYLLSWMGKYKAIYKKWAKPYLQNTLLGKDENNVFHCPQWTYGDWDMGVARLKRSDCNINYQYPWKFHGYPILIFWEIIILNLMIE